jgi:hypothetical protein
LCIKMLIESPALFGSFRTSTSDHPPPHDLDRKAERVGVDTRSSSQIASVHPLGRAGMSESTRAKCVAKARETTVIEALDAPSAALATNFFRRQFAFLEKALALLSQYFADGKRNSNETRLRALGVAQRRRNFLLGTGAIQRSRTAQARSLATTADYQLRIAMPTFAVDRT